MNLIENETLAHSNAVPLVRQFERGRDSGIVSKAGYTILEVMIFLAVSGFMFILAAVFINGRQDNVAFRQGMLAAGSTISSTIDDVANGRYPAIPDGEVCDAGTSGSPVIKPMPGPGVEQGSNLGCVFLGKALQFDQSLSGASDATKYITYNVIGRQFAPTAGSCSVSTSMQSAQSFCEAAPQMAFMARAGGSSADLRQEGTLEHGLEFAPTATYRCDFNVNCVSVYAVGFFGSFGSYGAGDAATQLSGAQTVAVATLVSAGTVPNVTNLDNTSVLSHGDFVVLCFSQGNKTGSVVIGGKNGQQTSVSVNFVKGDGLPC
ncbi:MAG: hypothetical protein ABI220_04940 [Candidatus Saccharimonadales bacterium]